MSRKRRYLVVTPDFPPDAGGIQLLVHRIACNIDEGDVTVVAFDTDGAAAFDLEQPYDVVRVPKLPFGGRVASLLRLNLAACRHAWRKRPEAVLSAHIVVAPAARLIQLALRKPYVQYLYAKEILTRPKLASYAVRHAAANIAISGYTEELAQAAGATPETLHLIAPGVDMPPRRETGRDATPTIVTIARLQDRHKGHDVLLRALPLIRARVPDARWVVLGHGPLRAHLEKLAESTGVTDAVTFEGAVSDDERDNWLARSTVFAMPSRVASDGGEGFGIVFLEANAHGLPVVGGDAGGAVDAVADGHTGLLVDATDHVAVAGAVCELLGDPERADAMGRAGVERARAFSWPAAGAQVERVLRAAAG